MTGSSPAQVKKLKDKLAAKERENQAAEKREIDLRLEVLRFKRVEAVGLTNKAYRDLLARQRKDNEANEKCLKEANERTEEAKKCLKEANERTEEARASVKAMQQEMNDLFNSWNRPR